MTLIHVGITLLAGALWAYLERKFGREYLDYKQSVRRWI